MPTVDRTAALRKAAEQITATYLEALIALVAATQLTDLDIDAVWLLAWAAVPAALNAAKAFLSQAAGWPLRPAAWWTDALTRVASTWAYSFVTILAATWTDKIDPSILVAAAWAAVPAALAAAKAIAARFVGDPQTAALDPKAR